MSYPSKNLRLFVIILISFISLTQLWKDILIIILISSARLYILTYHSKILRNSALKLSSSISMTLLWIHIDSFSYWLVQLGFTYWLIIINTIGSLLSGWLVPSICLILERHILIIILIRFAKLHIVTYHRKTLGSLLSRRLVRPGFTYWIIILNTIGSVLSGRLLPYIWLIQK